MNRFRVAIIGCGDIFPMHAVPINDLDCCELVGVCDIKPEVVQQRARELNCRAYIDYRQMIEIEQPDVVHICTPNFEHAPMAIFAAQHGAHILCEKPMSVEYGDAVEMVQAAKDNAVTLGVIFQNRYNPGSVLIKSALDSGMLGKVYAGRLSVILNRPDEYYQNSGWKGTWEQEGGGVLIGQAMHTMDLMRWFVGDDIEYVDASIANRAHSQIEVEDSAEGVIKYKSGIITTFFAVNYYTCDTPVELELHCQKGTAKLLGEKGTISFNDGRTLTADKNPSEAFRNGEQKQYYGVSHIKQIENFYGTLKNNTQPDITGLEALKTQKMVCGVYDSAKLGKRILF